MAQSLASDLQTCPPSRAVKFPSKYTLGDDRILESSECVVKVHVPKVHISINRIAVLRGGPWMESLVHSIPEGIRVSRISPGSRQNKSVSPKSEIGSPMVESSQSNTAFMTEGLSATSCSCRGDSHRERSTAATTVERTYEVAPLLIDSLEFKCLC